MSGNRMPRAWSCALIKTDARIYRPLLHSTKLPYLSASFIPDNLDRICNNDLGKVLPQVRRSSLRLIPQQIAVTNDDTEGRHVS